MPTPCGPAQGNAVEGDEGGLGGVITPWVILGGGSLSPGSISATLLADLIQHKVAVSALRPEAMLSTLRLSGEWEVPVTRNAKITPVNEGGGGRGSGGPPLRDHLWQGPPCPVTLRLIHPPPKMTQGGNDPPYPPLHHLQQHP